MDSSSNLIEFLSQLRKLDVHLTVDDGRLACNAPKGALTSEIKQALRDHKAEIIDLLQRNSQPAELPPIERLPSVESVPSSAQQRLWFLDRFNPNRTAYVIAGGLRFQGKLNRSALERSLQEIIRRHEVLRTAFVEVDGVPRAVLHPLREWNLEIISFEHLPEDQRLSSFLRYAEANRTTFDLGHPPLIRARLGVLAADDHGFIIDIHHICSDGWTLGLLTGELMALYAAFCLDQPPTLPEPPLQYSDYARWHRMYIENGAMQSHIAYWRRKLEAPLPTVDLPLDHPRPPVATFNGSIARQKLPIELLESVRRFSIAENVTPFVTLLAAYKVLLHRYTGQTDLIVGSVTAGRSRPELESMVGLFVNNLALRTDLSGDLTVRKLLARVHETAMGAFTHQDAPFDQLANLLQPERDMSRSVLFQTMFLVQNFPMRHLELPGLTASRLEWEGLGSRYDLTVEAFELDNRFQLIWEFNTDLFEAGTIATMQGCYRTLLEALVANPEARISELPLLNSSETDSLLRQAGTQTDPYPNRLCVHEWFEQQVASSPSVIAVTCGGHQLTYGELNGRANQLAGRLKQLGVGPNVLVGLCLDRSVDMAVALLAIQKAGGAYLPIDPEYPKDRIAFMLQDSEAAFLVTAEPLLSGLPANLPHTLCLDREANGLSQFPTHDLAGSAQPDDLLYIIYTSGSTGMPKGVEITHRSVVNFLASMQREPGMSSEDRLLAVTTLCFDIAGLEFYLPLVSGARLVVAPRAVAADGIALGELLETSGINVMEATPATWRLLLDSGWEGSPRLKVLCGGEAMPRELANRLLPCVREVWNLYGPTETTIWSTVHRVDSRPGAVPVGKPIGNTETYILDEHQRLVPPGVVGELYIGGLGVARGYHNRPELTSAKFVPDPFHPGARLYRTGDLARWLPGGSIDFLGRTDHQVKLRGYRIELGEIEAALQQQPGVKQALVIAREDTPGDQRLVAYVIPSPGSGSPESWRENLRATLPEYMVPSVFVSLDAFPLTPNRKFDRKRLPAPDVMPSLSAKYVPPRTGAEKELVDIWQDLLRVEQVGIHDNFFDLGGHSLLVVQLQNRLWRRFNCSVSLVELFQRPTVASMAGMFTEAAMQSVNGQ